MKVDVVIEEYGGCIEEISAHLSKDRATERVKEWFREHYPSENGYSEDYNFNQWKEGKFEFPNVFNECHEISVHEVEITGSDGEDLCKNCRQRKQ